MDEAEKKKILIQDEKGRFAKGNQAHLLRKKKAGGRLPGHRRLAKMVREATGDGALIVEKIMEMFNSGELSPTQKLEYAKFLADRGYGTAKVFKEIEHKGINVDFTNEDEEDDDFDDI